MRDDYTYEDLLDMNEEDRFDIIMKAAEEAYREEWELWEDEFDFDRTLDSNTFEDVY